MTKTGARACEIAIFIGLCFFLNPAFAAIDFLPDFLGALLMTLGLLPLARFSEPAADARRAFFRFAAADAVKNFLLLFVFGLGNAAERPTLVLTAAFLSLVSTIAFGIPAMRAFFGMAESFGVRFEEPYLYEQNGRKFNRPERNFRFFALFLIIRDVLGVLPEFTSLLQSSYVDSSISKLYEFIGALRLAALFPVAFLGIALLVSLVIFFTGMHTQTRLTEKLQDAYGSYTESHPGTAIKARFFLSFLLLGVGAFFFMDFYLDFRNIFPDAVGAVLVFAGVLLLLPPCGRKWPTLLLSILYGAMATVSTTASYRFSTSYSIGSVSKSEEAAGAYLQMWLLSLAEFLVFAVFSAFLLFLLRQVVHSYCGYRPEHSDEAFEERRTASLRQEFDGQFLTVYLFGFISALFSFLYDYLKEVPGKGFFRILEFFWFADFSMALVFAILFSVLLSRIYRQICARYQFE